jgi:predicted ATPase
MIHLRTIVYKKPADRLSSDFPFNLQIFHSLGEMNFTSQVTFLVGENGSGKSTLLEALACAIGSITIGSQSVNTDETLAAVRAFSMHLRLVWNRRTRRGFFLRAEDFFGYARRMAQINAEMRVELDAVESEYRDRSELAKGLAKMPYARELSDMQRRYGDGLDSQSHGESFLALFQSRFVPGGLYLLDEPEVPLSPLRQIGLLALIKEMTAQDAQFIIATHSPILMAFPQALILSFDEDPVQSVEYESLEHVNLTRDFLNNPEAFLRHL